jgi:reductive dehalogenase
LVLLDIGVVVFTISSLTEKEYRAASIASTGLIVNTILWCFLIFQHNDAVIYKLNIAIVILFAVFIIVSLMKFFPSIKERDTTKIEKYDERDYMFSRNMLKFHPELADRYYSMHPDKKKIDTQIHEKPELGESGHTFFDAYESPVFRAAFTYLDRTHDIAFGSISSPKKDLDINKVTRTIIETGHLYGAVDVGITPVQPYHIYSHRGRQPDKWGEEINTAHKSAVVIVVAMSVEHLKKAPALPSIQESARQYVECAKIADIIAEYIRSIGYGARSHKDGFYETLCVPMAVDAGLGALGRLGIFMHPVYGPCVRLSIVTTDMELIPTRKKPDLNSIDRFCIVCKKCAENCPTKSIINNDDEPVSRGVRHWSIDQEKCYSFWKKVGTDCGICIRVCPYTKPNTLIHKLIRFYVSRNSINQWIAVFMDDLFYGRKIPLASILSSAEANK